MTQARRVAQAILDTDDKIKRNIHISQLSDTYRGKIIDSCIELEKAIEAYVSIYLTKDPVKQLDIILLLLDRLSFDSKISVFETILKQNNSADIFKKQYYKLLGKIRAVKDERNIFAHYSLDVSEIANKNAYKEISFLKMRNTLSVHTYSNEKFDSIFEQITECVQSVTDMSDFK